MAYKIDKETEDLVINGWEQGISRSPLSGIANLQAVNIQTENREVMCSFSRIQQSQPGTTDATHTFAPLDGSHLSTTFTLTAGVWVNVSSSTITGLSTGNYYVLTSTGSAQLGGNVALSQFYNSSAITGLGATGTATFTLIRSMGQPIGSATEPYMNGSGQQYRYYILDNQGLVWVYDTAQFVLNGIEWFLPDFSINYYGSVAPTGIAILNGWLHVFAGNTIWSKPTVNLASSTSTTTNWASFASGVMLSTNATHFAYAGHQGALYYTDGNFIGKIFPDTSLLSGTANIQSYASYTTSTTTGTISQLISGSVPYNGTDNTIRIPAVFFHALTTSAANPSDLTIGTIYYIQYNSPTEGNFEVYTDPSGGSALDITTGAVGTQYFATYYPISADGEQTITFTPERLNLPFFESSISMTEIGSLLIIGTRGNVLYPWNQVDPTPSDLIPLPENNVTFLLTVNNMAYAFAGNKGNIYLTNGSTASLVITVPDYCAGIPGSPATYIEPYFIWGGAMYLRGRVYFSILDQTASKTGNCGGIWSFVPTQNFFIGQDTGLSLRIENQNSYGSYNGVTTVLLASQAQNAIGPQFWSGWYSSVSSPLYGIDFSGTQTSTQGVIETDLIPTGTLLKKQTFEQIEYKMSTPLDSGATVTIKYRLNSTDAYSSISSLNAETGLSGYFVPTFQNTQWLQLQIILTPVTSSSGSFNRLSEIRIR